MTDTQNRVDQREDRSNNRSSRRQSRTRTEDSSRPDSTGTLAPLMDAESEQWLGNDEWDVMLSLPNVGIDYIKVEVDNIDAQVELHAKVADLLELHVGAHVHIDKVEVDIENVRIQGMLKVRLDKVQEMVASVAEAISQNPGLNSKESDNEIEE